MGMAVSVVIFAAVVGSVWKWGALLCRNRRLDASEERRLKEMLGR